MSQVWVSVASGTCPPSPFPLGGRCLFPVRFRATTGVSMHAVIQSAAVVGVVGHVVRCEVGLAGGVPAFTLVGLPDTAVREARERVRAAIESAGFVWPRARITVNLAPAALPKSGSWFDLPIALGILVAAGSLPGGDFRDCLVVGELGLDGSVRAVPGVLPAAIRAQQCGLTLVAPVANIAAAEAVPRLAAVGASRLEQFSEGLPPPQPASSPPVPCRATADFGDVVGHEAAKLGLKVAASGGHHCLLVGEPGSGKTMLARRLPGILPPLGDDDRLEASLAHSIAGISDTILSDPPFRAPHHSATMAALVGGGSGRVVPGEVSLAHCGVLFLDELGEFRPSVLDALRQPLEDGNVTVSRRGTTVTLPARFTLVAASNPCPCGYLGSARRACTCDPAAVARYSRRLSGPLLDRIDLTIPVAAVAAGALIDHRVARESDAMRDEVQAARRRQMERLGAGVLNAHMQADTIADGCPLTPAAAELLGRCAMRASSRAVVSIRKVAMTLADLAAEDAIGPGHVQLAWRMRGGAPSPGQAPLRGVAG